MYTLFEPKQNFDQQWFYFISQNQDLEKIWLLFTMNQYPQNTCINAYNALANLQNIRTFGNPPIIPDINDNRTLTNDDMEKILHFSILVSLAQKSPELGYNFIQNTISQLMKSQAMTTAQASLCRCLQEIQNFSPSLIQFYCPETGLSLPLDCGTLVRRLQAETPANAYRKLSQWITPAETNANGMYSNQLCNQNLLKQWIKNPFDMVAILYTMEHSHYHSSNSFRDKMLNRLKDDPYIQELWHWSSQLANQKYQECMNEGHNFGTASVVYSAQK